MARLWHVTIKVEIHHVEIHHVEILTEQPASRSTVAAAEA